MVPLLGPLLTGGAGMNVETTVQEAIVTFWMETEGKYSVITDLLTLLQLVIVPTVTVEPPEAVIVEGGGQLVG